MQVLACIDFFNYSQTVMAHSRDRILEASLELFSARGYSAVTTKAIAEAAKVNEVTVFRLFGSKDRLFREVFAAFYIKPDEAIRSMGLRYDLESDLIAFAGTFFDFFSSNHKIVNMSIKDIKAEFDDIDGALRGQADIMRSAVSPYLVNMVERGKAVGRPDDLAALFVECLYGFAFRRIMFGGIDALGPAAIAFARIFARGIASGGD
jgi:AcrR family transcriptional regulator